MVSSKSVCRAPLVAPTCRRGLFRGRRTTCTRSRGRRRAPDPPALVRGGVAGRLAAPRSPDALSAAVVLVDRRPGATFGFLLRNAAAFVTFLDMLRLALLLFGVLRLIAAWHGFLLRSPRNARDQPVSATKVPAFRRGRAST